MGCVIDPNGTPWHFEKLSRHLLDGIIPIPGSLQELLETLVKGYGYIGLTGGAKASQIFFNCNKLTEVSLEAAFGHLRNRASAIVISAMCGHGHWDCRLHESVTSAVNHIAEIAEQFSRQKQNRFLNSPLDEYDLKSSNTPQLADAIDVLRSSDYRLGEDVVYKLAGLVRDRFMICERTPTLGRWSVNRIGNGYNHLNADLKGGLFLSHHRNCDYGQWTEDQYDMAWAGSVPTADELDISFLSGRGDQRRVQYRRILVPIEPTGDRQLLFSASLIDGSVDLVS